MISIQAKILLGIFAAVLVASALTIWLILSFGNGPVAMLTPVLLALAVLVVTRSVVNRGRSGPPK